MHCPAVGGLDTCQYPSGSSLCSRAGAAGCLSHHDTESSALSDPCMGTGQGVSTANSAWGRCTVARVPRTGTVLRNSAGLAVERVMETDGVVLTPDRGGCPTFAGVLSGRVRLATGRAGHRHGTACPESRWVTGSTAGGPRHSRRGLPWTVRHRPWSIRCRIHRPASRGPRRQ
jgi:hypothetical protein